MVRVILIDNHDSFTGNLFQLFDENKRCQIEVVDISQLEVDRLDYYDKIVISPGPDIPKAYPKLFSMMKLYANHKSILGVCLGHQALIEFFGGKLYHLPRVMHGQKERIQLDTSASLFRKLPKAIEGGLYHSWAADVSTLPSSLKIIAKSENGVIMAIHHNTLDCTGVQFHPESYMTPLGAKIIDNWIQA